MGEAESPGDLLRRLRVARGLTQSQLDRLSNIRQSLISRYEQGTRGMTTKTARALARALRVPAETLTRGAR